MTMRLRRFTVAAALLGGASLLLHSSRAAACGGFFCSQSQPVNQAAERIIFADNGDGTVTAVIQILYEGPSENFSWLLPISSVPDAEGEIAVASDIAFQRLQAATNPQYNLTTVVEGTCRADSQFNGGPTALPGAVQNDSLAEAPRDSGVKVAASGVVGAFEWTALSLDASLESPADAALEWLTENGYDVLPQSAELIGPYLESGMYLLALRLTKGATTGSIRPIVLTYEGELPSIPIKLTAVAANENMGVMTWMLSNSRAVPYNYNALELNEARINWFNAAANYNDVVIAAADESGGQGFVTEFAGASNLLGQPVWSELEEQQFQSLKTQPAGDAAAIFMSSYYQYAGFDGFWEVARQHVQPPDGISQEQFEACPDCYGYYDAYAPPTEGNFRFTSSTAAYLEQLEADVIEPVRLVQRLIDAHPYTTRLYSTLSASEMTVDPVFTYNADLPDLSNIHNATQTIECNPNLFASEAPWRIDLPQGGVIRGTAANGNSWPGAVDAQPANLRVLTLSDSGTGRVSRDNSTQIQRMLAQYNDSVPVPPPPPPPRNPLAPGELVYGDGSGCALHAPGGAGSAGTSLGAAALALLLGLRSRRRR